MPNKLNNLPVKANADIQPSAFVMLDPTTDFKVVPATGASAFPVGISQVGPKFAPGVAAAVGGSTAKTVAAEAGDNVGIYTLGDLAPLTLASSTTATPGMLLTSDQVGTQGYGVPASTGVRFGAIALEGGTGSTTILTLVAYGTM